MRTYEATYDNGRDCRTFLFVSSHRAGSEANKEDARTEMILKYGMRARNYKIVSIYRAEGR